MESELPAMLARDADHWWYRGRRRIVIRELERLSPPPDARLLDAGSGSGRTLDDLSRFGRATGLDVNPTAVRTARARGHNVRQADILDMPLPDDRFDVVSASTCSSTSTTTGWRWRSSSAWRGPAARSS